MDIRSLMTEAYLAGLDHGIYLCEEEVRALVDLAPVQDKATFRDLVETKQAGRRSLANLRRAIDRNERIIFSDRMVELMQRATPPEDGGSDPHPDELPGATAEAAQDDDPAG